MCDLEHTPLKTASLKGALYVEELYGKKSRLGGAVGEAVFSIVWALGEERRRLPQKAVFPRLAPILLLSPLFHPGLSLSGEEENRPRRPH